MSFLLRWLRPAHLSNRRFARDEVWLPFLPFHLRAVRMIPERFFFPMGRRFVRYSPASGHLEKGRTGIRLFSHADEYCELYAVGRSQSTGDSPPASNGTSPAQRMRRCCNSPTSTGFFTIPQICFRSSSSRYFVGIPVVINTRCSRCGISDSRR